MRLIKLTSAYGILYSTIIFKNREIQINIIGSPAICNISIINVRHIIICHTVAINTFPDPFFMACRSRCIYHAKKPPENFS